MNLSKKTSAPRYERDGITSYLLVPESCGGSTQLSVTLVEMEPGGFQHTHSHQAEQTYYVIEGSGVMTVDAEQRQVEAGDCIFFASGSRHGLRNTGDTVLRYLSAASPSFTEEECRQLWPLKSLDA